MVVLFQKSSLYFTPSAGAARPIARGSPTKELNLRGRERPIFADLQIANRQRSKLRTHQLQRLAAHRFQHSPHLPVAPLSDAQLDETVLTRIAKPLHLRRLRRT